MKTYIGILITTLLLLAGSLNLAAADLYWIGNTGSWNDGTHWSLSSGGPACGCSPTSTDNAIFDASSFSTTATVSMSGTNDVGAVNWSAIDEAVSWTGSSTLNVYGDFILSSLLTSGLSNQVRFQAPSGFVDIDFAGVSISNALYFQGEAGQWNLQSDLTSTSQIVLQGGALLTNSYDLSFTSFTANSSAPTLLVLGNSELTLTGFWSSTASDHFILPGTSTIRMMGNNTTFSGGNKSFNNLITEGEDVFVNGGVYQTVTMTKGGSLAGSPSIDILNLQGGYEYEFSSTGTLSLGTDLNVLTDCVSYANLSSTSTTSQATIEATSGTINLNFVQITRIDATGGATFNASNATLYESTGWNETAPAVQSLYWIGSTGDWSDGANWSLSSGGAPANCIPNRSTDVFFDANSFVGAGHIVTITTDNAYCRSVQWSGVTGNPTLSMTAFGAEFFIYGSVEFDAGMTTNITQNSYLRAPSGTSTIRMNGKSFARIYFQGEGRYRLLDDFYSTFLFHERGRLDSQGQDLFISGYNSNYTNERILRLSNSTMQIAPGITLEWNVNSTNLLFDAGTSTIEFTGSSQQLIGTGLQFYDIRFLGSSGSVNSIAYARNVDFTSNGTVNNCDYIENVSLTGGGSLSISSDNNIDNVVVDGSVSVNFGDNIINSIQASGNGSFSGTGYYQTAQIDGNCDFLGEQTFGTLTLAAGTNHSIQSTKILYIENDLIANGDCSSPISFEPSSSSSASISKSSGSIVLDYVTLTNIEAIGGASFVVNNATDGGGNTGWTLNLPVSTTFYWIGGSGNWQDPSNWATSSGGAPQACIPGRQDNVVFDANSFSGPGQTVTIDEPAFCNGMLWQSISNNPTLSMTASAAELSINGSMFLDPNMTVSVTQEIRFTSPGGLKNLQFAGHELSTVYFSGGATEWRILDEMRTGRFFHESGSINTNNQDVYMLGYESTTTLLRRLRLGTSTINITTTSLTIDWNLNSTNYILDAGTSLIRFPGNNQAIIGPDLVFYDIEFSATNGQVISVGGAHHITFLGTSGTVSNAGNVQRVVGTNITLNNDTDIDTVIANGNLTVNSGLRKIGYLQVGGTATISGTTDIEMAILNDDAAINDFSSFGSLMLAAGKVYTLESGQTQVVRDLLFGMGACDQLIFLQSSGPTQASLQIDSGVVDLEYVSLTGINAIGATNFVVNSATDGSNNTGWVLLQPPTTTYYWVGNGGNWNDPTHWAISSGGAPQVCIPSSADDVVFDINSFTLPGQTVLVDADAVCRSMFWENLDDQPIFDLPNTVNLQLFGGIELYPDMTANLLGDIFFEADTGEYAILMEGHSFDNIFFVGDSATWTLIDTMRCNDINHERGRLNTNGETALIRRYLTNFTNPRWLDLGDSDFYISFPNSSAWIINTSNFNLDAGTSNIIFTGSSSVPPTLTGNGLNFYEATWTGTGAGANSFDTIQILNFNNTGSTNLSGFDYVGSAFFTGSGNISGSGKIERLTTQGNMTFNGSLEFNDVVLQANATFTNHPSFSNLTLEPGADYTVTSNDTLIVENFLFADGTAGALIFLHSSSATQPAYIRKNNGELCMDYINLQNMRTSGTAIFNVGANSVDLGGNVGWNFSGCVYSCDQVSNYFITDLGTTVATMNFDEVEGAFNYLLRWREVGTGPWNFVLIDVNEPTMVSLDALDFGVSYEWQVKTYCNESQTLESLWGPLQTFATTCVPPQGLAVTNVLTNAATFNWENVPGAFRYTFQGRFAGTTAWFTLNIPNPAATSFDVDVLSPDKTIEWRMRTTCSADGSILSAYSPIQTFTTQSIPVPPPCVVDLGPAMVDVCGIDTLLDAGPGFQYYLWNTGDTTQTITVNTPGTYFVTTQWEFCITGDTIQVDFPGCLLRTAEAEERLKVFPNPASRYTQLTFDRDRESISLRLLSIDGREMRFVPEVTGGSYSLDLKGIKPGMYIVEIRDGNFTEQSKLIVTE